MKYALTIPNRGPLTQPDNLARLAQRAEELGFHSLLIGDHILVPNNIASRYPYSAGGEFSGAATGEAVEQLTMLSFLAGVTRKVRLVTGVMIVPHRNPLVAAKALATIDVLSKGRLTLGIGAGWLKEEFDAVGVPPFEERGAVTDEYIRAFKELWTSDNPSFHGKYCSFSDIRFFPQPVQKPHPPIWVGGESPRAMRRAAELGNGWFPIGANPDFHMGTPEQLSDGIKRLASAVRRAGREPSEIEISYKTYVIDLRETSGRSNGERRLFTGTAQEIASDIRSYEEIGVSHLVVDSPRLTKLEDVLRSIEEFATRVWPLV